MIDKNADERQSRGKDPTGRRGMAALLGPRPPDQVGARRDAGQRRDRSRRPVPWPSPTAVADAAFADAGSAARRAASRASRSSRSGFSGSVMAASVVAVPHAVVLELRLVAVRRHRRDRLARRPVGGNARRPCRRRHRERGRGGRRRRRRLTGSWSASSWSWWSAHGARRTAASKAAVSGSRRVMPPRLRDAASRPLASPARRGIGTASSGDRHQSCRSRPGCPDRTADGHHVVHILGAGDHAALPHSGSGRSGRTTLS